MTGWMSKQCRQSLRRGYGDSMYTRKVRTTLETLLRGQAHDQPDAREGQAGHGRVAERLVVLAKSGNADGGKEPWFKADAGSNERVEIGATLSRAESRVLL